MGQFTGLLYKNLKIQSKNKFGVCCQLMTPMICILIIYGLQKLVDSLKLDGPSKIDHISNMDPLQVAKKLNISNLMRGYQPNFGSHIIRSINQMQKELEEAEVFVDSARVLSGEERSRMDLDQASEYQLVRTHKLMDATKVPFNLVVPLNLPISNESIRSLLKDQFKLKTCYKIIKFGVSGNDGTKEFLQNELRIDQNDSDLRRVNCQVKKKKKKQPSMRVPNLSFMDNLKSADDINTQMVKNEFTKLETYDLFKIDKEVEPTDGFMLFEEASPNKIKALLSTNNMQFFAYHHVNFMSMVKTMADYRIFMNTETHLTMIDILTNSILMNRFNNYRRGQPESLQAQRRTLLEELTKTLENHTISDLIKMHLQYLQDKRHGKVEPKVRSEQSSLGSKVNKLRQVITLSLTFPDRSYNKIIMANMFQLLNVIFYPFAIGLCLPIILSSLAIEKEERIHDLLKTNGMSMFKFYLSNFAFWFVFCSIVTFIFFLGGYVILDDTFFSNNSFGHIFFFSLGWNIQQIVFAFFILSMISTRGAASAIGNLLSTLGILFSVNLSTFIYPFPGHMPYWWNILPQSNMVRIIYFFLVNGSTEIQSVEKNEFHVCMFFLYFNCVIYGALIYAISNKHFWKKMYRKFIKRKTDYPEPELLEIPSEEKLLASEESFTEVESFDTQPRPDMHKSASLEKDKIRKIVNSTEIEKYRKKLAKLAIMCHDLDKVYDNGKHALKSLSLKIKKGEVYGLLGPNGAGKTTLISILTGFLGKNDGLAFVNGLNIDEQRMSKKLALCPQFNIQWPNLTVREHLKIFGMLRNIKLADIDGLVEEIIAKVGLEDKKDAEASKLSGGMRRRLSIAISLMGNTEIIFLDEPTTGLDPKRRRELWEIIKSNREEKTFIISTHLMEEAEFLCDRIGIMTLGQLRAVGTSNYLKKAFVDYFKVELILKDEFETWTEEMKMQLNEQLQWSNYYEFGNLIKAKIENNEERSYLEIFKAMKTCEKFVKSWALKNGSLEDAFEYIENKFK